MRKHSRMPRHSWRWRRGRRRELRRGLPGKTPRARLKAAATWVSCLVEISTICSRVTMRPP